jgi:hypothetical protein
MVDCRGDWIHTCYSGSRPWSTRVAEENGWSVTIRPSVLFFLPQWYLPVAVFYPIPDINAQPQTTWVYEWEDPDFYNMLVGEWQTTSAWTGLTWQQYKGELLRTRGLNVMSSRVPLHDPAGDLSFLPMNLCCMNYLYELICMNYLYLNYQLTYARLVLLCLV